MPGVPDREMEQSPSGKEQERGSTFTCILQLARYLVGISTESDVRELRQSTAHEL